MSSTEPSFPPPSPELDLRAYARVLLKHGRLIVLLCGVACLSAAGFSFLTPPTYRAGATIRVYGGQRGQMLLDNAAMPLWGGENQIETEVEMIRSRRVAEDVVDQLHLQFVLSNVTVGWLGSVVPSKRVSAEDRRRWLIGL